MIPVETLDVLLGAGTIALQAITVVLVAAYLLRARYPLAAEITRQAGEYAVWVSCIASLVGVAATLYYSEIVGYIPCGLCWLGRVFVYPQVILFAIALWNRDRERIADYSLGLSIPGALVALYTHYIQMGGSEVVPCPASGVGDCAKRYVFEFGYVTMPMMGFALVCFLIILMIILRSRRATI